ncbi:MAG: hypothetical protein IPM29_18320 [Planctomycetes bacterium]|nr:hypothetical protein [Planctomycetota bacterium]
MPTLSRTAGPLLACSLLAAAVAAQQGAATALGFVDLQAELERATGARAPTLTGLAVGPGGELFVTAPRRALGLPHRLLEFDAQGGFVAGYDAPATLDGSAVGLRDGCFERGAGRLYFAVDPAGSAAGNVVAFDLATRRFAPAANVTAHVATPSLRGLAWDGVAFWTASLASPLTAFDRTGVERSRFAPPADGVVGLAWDEDRGTLWVASLGGARSGGAQPGNGVHLLEWDPRTGVATGFMFRADHALPPGEAALPAGAEIHRVGGRLVISVIVQGLRTCGLVQCEVDALVGSGCGPSIDYTGGNAWIGNTDFALRAAGLAESDPAVFAAAPDATLTGPIPGLIGCSFLATIVAAFPVAVSPGGEARLAAPIALGTWPGAVAFQALQLATATARIRASPALYVAVLR